LEAQRLRRQEITRQRQQAESLARQDAQSASTNLDLGERPTLDMLDQYELCAAAAQFRYAEASGFDVHRDCFGEDPSTHLDPVSFDCNRTTPAVVSDHESIYTEDSEVADVPELSKNRKDWSVKDRLRAYNEVMGPNAATSACASCGTREIGKPHKCIALSEIDCLYTEGSRLEQYNAAGEFQDVFHIFEYEGKLYDVHSELLLLQTLPPLAFAPLRAPLCETCHIAVRKHKRPDYNVGIVDYGRRTAKLAGMTEAEELAVSRCIRFQNIVKIRSSATATSRGHVIAFPCDAPDAMATRLPRLDLGKFINVAFVGSRELYMKKTKAGAARRRWWKECPQLTVNVDRIEYALRLKKAIDPAYADIDIDTSPEARSALESFNDQLLDPEGVLLVDNAKDMLLDAATDSNIARQEPFTQQQQPSEPDNGDDDVVVDADESEDAAEEIAFERIFVHPPVQTPLTEGRDVLRAVDRLVNGADEGVNDPVSVNVEGTAVNEFGDSDLYFNGSFPFLFMFGQGVAPGSSGISAKQLRHMLTQADNRFARSSAFIFTVFNQMQRHAVCRAVNLKAKGGQASMERFMAIIEQGDFSERLLAALQDPESPQAKALAVSVLSVARVPGANVPWSGLERKSAMCKLLAIVMYSGVFSIFGTVSPADMDSSLLLELACTPRSGELGSFSQATAKVNIKLPTLLERHRILAENPVAAAQVYKRLVENMFDILIGLPACHTVRKSPPPVSERGEGLLGTPITFGGVTEAQQRHSPHLHFLLCTDMSPMAIQQYCDQPEIMKLLCNRLDSIVRCYVPVDAKLLVQPVVAEDLSEPTIPHRDTRKPVDYDNAVEVDVITRANAAAFSCNMHKHALTCHKGKLGRFRCRLSMNRALWCRETEVLQLFATHTANGTLVPKALRHVKDPSDYLDPLSIWNDPRVLVLELYRPHPNFSSSMHSRCPSTACAESHENSDCTHEYYVDIDEDPTTEDSNARMVTFCPALTAILGCNTDISPLGTFAQAKSAIFYLVKYLGKEGNELGNIVPLVNAAHQYCEKYPSKADDSGTTKRTSIYILTRLLNCMAAEVEVGAQIAALAISEFPSNIFSHEFFYCFIHPSINYCKKVHKQMPPSYTTANQLAISAFQSLSVNDAAFEGDQDEDIGDEDEIVEAVDGIDDGQHEDDVENKEIVLDANNKIVFISQALDYKYRAPSRIIRGEDPAVIDEFVAEGCPLLLSQANHRCMFSCQSAANVDDLGDFSFYEYCGIVRLRTRTTTQENPESHRVRDKLYELHTMHPARSDRVQQLRSKQFIPLLAGSPSPHHPGPKRDDNGWRNAANRFAAYVITLHHPWSLITFAPPIALTWEALAVWVQQLKRSDRYIDRARLHWLRLLGVGRSVKSETIKLLQAWRSRKATYWSKADHDAAELEMSATSTTDFEIDLDDVINELADPFSTLPPVEKGSKADVHRSMVVSQLQSISVQAENNQPADNQGINAAISNMRFDQVNRGQFAGILEVISRKSSAVEEFLSNVAENTVVPALHPSLRHGLPQEAEQLRPYNEDVPPDLNSDQARVFSQVVRWANDDVIFSRNPMVSIAPPPLRILISSAAGTGKTHTVCSLFKRLTSSVMASVSITGVAASNLPKGTTIHSTFAKSVNSRAKPSESHARLSFGKPRILVIDEISTTSCEAFLWVNNVLCRWFPESQQSFGGMGVIIMGDFFQQGPVGRSLLQASMIDGNPAGDLFKEFQRIEFTQQQRASHDTLHSERLLYFRAPLTTQTPVLTSQILKELKVISAKDLQEDPKWATAPIICSDNVTRHAINKLKIFELARRIRSPVIAVRLPLAVHARTAFTAASIRTRTSMEKLQDQHDNLTFYFVPGAPVMCKDNISPSFGIANGTQAVLHSLTLNPEKVDVDDVWQQISLTQPGELFELQVLPLSINIVLINSQQAFDAQASLFTDNLVVPVLLNTRSPRILKVAGRSNLPRKLTFYDYGIDLAFALTYFKVQGLTLERIILDLDTTVLPRIGVAAMYVGLSRVRQGDHIRILPISSGGQLALNHLKFQQYLVDWLKRPSST
jgi:hypothetical protein